MAPGPATACGPPPSSIGLATHCSTALLAARHLLHVDQLLDELLQLVPAEPQLAAESPDGEAALRSSTSRARCSLATKLTRQV